MKRSLIILIISTFLIQATVFADETSDPSSLKQKIKITLSGKDFDWPDWDMFRGERDISDLLNIATTAPEPNGTMFFHADIPDTILNAGPVDAQIFYGGGSNWGFNDAYFLGTTGYENTFEAFAPTPGSGQFDIGVQATLTYEGAEATVSQGPYNSANSDPAPYYLSVGDEPSGDQDGGSNFDIVDVGISFTDERVFVKLTNAGGGFPVGGFFGPWNIYAVGFLNPEDEDQTLFGLAYCDGGFGLFYPGLWKFQAGSDLPEPIGDINYSISGNNLYMSANWSDIFSDPDFGSWPNEFEILGMAGITIEASLTEQTFADQTPPAIFNPSIQSFTIGENTPPSLSNHGFEITGDSEGLYDVAFYCSYLDEDNHFPLLSQLSVDGEIIETMSSADHNYADSSIFTVQTALAPGNHTYEMSFSDGMSDVGTGAISFTVGSDEETEYAFTNLPGWNMVGLSVGVEDENVSIIFPEAINETLYSFDGSYILEENLVNGQGYWLRFDNAGSTTISGTPINELTITLSEGWNMISGISFPVSVDFIIDPSGLIIPGTVYGFNGSYFSESTIETGYGYWLRSVSDGEITLSESGNSRKMVRVHLPESANTLRVNGQTLYFGVDIPYHDRLSYSLPPKPPAGAFDIRFEGDWKYTGESGTMELMANSDYVNMEYFIHDDGIWELIGSKNSSIYNLTGSGTLIIPGNSTEFYLRKVPSLPSQYSLLQNYPNPFNPVTFITYTILEMSYIEILVYNLAGQEINELVSEIKAPGQYSISWDGTDNLGNPVASGVYFYMFHGNRFSDMKKMILMK